MEETAIAAFPGILRKGGPLPPGAAPSKYVIMGFLGNGAFGSALLVERCPAYALAHGAAPPPPGSDPVRLVAKIVDLSQMSERNQTYARSEIATLALCHHPSIIRYEDDYKSADDKLLLLVMEFADAGDLARQISTREKAGQPFSEVEASFLFAQTLLALDYLHRNRIMHRDLKCANVFLTIRGAVKLGDFGFSQQYENTVSDAVAGTFCGTPYYIAPEVWKSRRYSKKADIWSLGVITHQTCALAAPFTAPSMNVLMERIITGQRTVTLDQKGYPNLEPVVAWMLTIDTQKRPTTRQVLHHPYVRRILDQLQTAIENTNSFSQEHRAQVAADIAFIVANPPRDKSLMPPPPTRDPGAARSPTDINYDIFHEGPVNHLSANGWKKRHLKLERGNIIVSIVQNGQVMGSKTVSLEQVRGCLPLPAHHAEGATSAFVIEIVGGRSVLQAPSDAERDAWLAKLQAATGEDGGDDDDDEAGIRTAASSST